MTDEPFEMIRGAKFPTYSRGYTVRYGRWQGHSVCTRDDCEEGECIAWMSQRDVPTWKVGDTFTVRGGFEPDTIYTIGELFNDTAYPYGLNHRVTWEGPGNYTGYSAESITDNFNRGAWTMETTNRPAVGTKIKVTGVPGYANEPIDSVVEVDSDGLSTVVAPPAYGYSSGSGKVYVQRYGRTDSEDVFYVDWEEVPAETLTVLYDSVEAAKAAGKAEGRREILEKLKAEAVRRGGNWCDEYEEFIEENNFGDEYKRRRTVSVDVNLSFTTDVTLEGGELVTDSNVQQRILDSHSVSRYDIDSVVENN